MYFKNPGDIYNLKKNLEKIDEISRFEENWNGYGAKSFSPPIIKTIKRLLTELDLLHIPQPFVAPYSDGLGFQIEWEKTDGEYLEIQVTMRNPGNHFYKVVFGRFYNNKPNLEIFWLEGVVGKKPTEIAALVIAFLGMKGGILCDL